MLKIHPIGVRFVSKCATSGFLKTLNAYTCPIDKWTASAADGISQRAYPIGAIVRSRSSTPTPTVSLPLWPLTPRLPGRPAAYSHERSS